MTSCVVAELIIHFQNHSCDPNCNIVACYINDQDVEKPLLAIFTNREVKPGEELCFSYYGSPDDEDEDPVSSILVYVGVV